MTVRIMMFMAIKIVIISATIIITDIADYYPTSTSTTTTITTTSIVAFASYSADKVCISRGGRRPDVLAERDVKTRRLYRLSQK
jgi:hypothetical protein